MSPDQGIGPGNTASQTVARAIAALQAGRPVLVADAFDRESEVDVVLPARAVAAKWIAWTIRHTSGYLCAPMTAARADALELPLMVPDNAERWRTQYCVSVDAAVGITTGISAADRAHTLRVLADPATTPDDLVRPGHVLPLRAAAGGVLERPGHTEAAIDLLRLAGLGDVGVIAELVNDDGTMMRLPDVGPLAAKHKLEVLAIHRLQEYLRAGGTEPVVEAPPTSPLDGIARVAHISAAHLPTEFGDFRIHTYKDQFTDAEHAALVSDGTGNAGEYLPYVRIHSECLTGDSFGSKRCDCGPQLHESMRQVGLYGGAVVHLHGHEGRGIGLSAKVAAYALQDQGRDTVEANLDLGFPVDAREFGAAAAILTDLGMTRVWLLTNNPDKVEALRAAGIEVVDRVPLEVGLGPDNSRYLHTKKHQMGHLLDLKET